MIESILAAIGLISSISSISIIDRAVVICSEKTCETVSPIEYRAMRTVISEKLLKGNSLTHKEFTLFVNDLRRKGRMVFSNAIISQPHPEKSNIKSKLIEKMLE